MIKDMTRARLIQAWFGAVAVAAVASMAFGAVPTLGTAAILLAGCLVPPVVVFLLWPGDQSQTAADVLHGVDRSA